MYWTCGTSTVFCTSESQALVVATQHDVHSVPLEHGWNNTSGKGPSLSDRNRNVCHSIETLELTNIHSPLYCLDDWSLALYRRWHVHHWIKTLELGDTTVFCTDWIFGTSRWNNGQFVNVLDL